MNLVLAKRPAIYRAVICVLAVALCTWGQTLASAGPSLQGESGSASSNTAAGQTSSCGFSGIDSSSPAHVAICWVSERTEFSAGTASPSPSESAITRGQFATTLYRLNRVPSAARECGLADVPPAASFAPAACWLKSNALISAATAIFSPMSPLTRASLALILYRDAGRPSAPDHCGYADDAVVPPLVRSAACWVKAEGGLLGDAFDGKRTTNFAETAHLLWIRFGRPQPLTDPPLAFFVDPQTDAARQAILWGESSPADAILMSRLARRPVAHWIGRNVSDPAFDANSYVSAAQATGRTGIVVIYAIPNRDCGGPSSGGMFDWQDYQRLITDVAAGIGRRRTIVILEPDSLALTSCLTEQELDARLQGLQEARATLEQSSDSLVYLDGGHSGWHSPDEMAGLLARAGVGSDGRFALNVASFRTTDESLSYGERISGLLGGARFVVDTSRNGLGPSPLDQWCNPPGRAVGANPTTRTRSVHSDAYLWIKTPGRSDGDCNGGPSAGTWWPEAALELAQNRWS